MYVISMLVYEDCC